MGSNVAVFQQKTIRRTWDKNNEKWWFSVTDVVSVLSNSVDALVYWRKLKEQLKKEGSETVTNCHQLKLTAEDGKMRLTDVADIEVLFRLVQSIPNPKAEPIKLWLAKVGHENQTPARKGGKTKIFTNLHLQK